MKRYDSYWQRMLRSWRPAERCMKLLVSYETMP